MSAPFGQMVQRPIIWNPIATIRSTGLPSILPKWASAASRPMAAHGGSDLDHSALVQTLENMANHTVA